ncbi:MAG TPA: hypothetical protein ENJ54_03315 [Chloroflexi bacterium]|nr:hypothetical protein [Chloroflexota bacterium]
MNRTLKVVLVAVGGVMLLAAAFVAGAWAMRGASTSSPAAATQEGAAAGRRGNGNMQGNGSAQGQNGNGAMRGENGSAMGSNDEMEGNGPTAMGSGNGGMMDSDDEMMGNGYGNGGAMMGGGYGNGEMMDAYASNPEAQPLTLPEAQSAVEAYLQRLGNPDLQLGEVMIFDNHAYAEIIEKSTGVGAMEVLVDPATRTVYPEPGPNMMWNQKYGRRGNGGMMGYGAASTTPTADMPITPAKARQLAQQFLDRNYPGVQVATEADPFYGYYTLHTLKDGQVIGMLSVNGYTGQVFLHTWHGKFITMSNEAH